MGKVAFVFPGQGSQQVGMGKDVYEIYPEIQEIYHRTDERLGFELSRIIFEDEEKLNLTQYTQPALVITSYALFYALKKSRPDVVPSYTAGHSLGEFSALVASDALNPVDAVWITHIRGKLMQEAVPEGAGKMAAIIGLPAEEIEKTLQEISGIVEVANYNSPEQTVISGETEAVEKAMEVLKEKGAKKVVPLAVSVPAHSSLLRDKAEEFGKYLEEIEIKDAQIPVISNITGKPLTDAGEIRKELKEHFYSPVRWVQSVQFMVDEGVDAFIEIGPKKVLTGLIRRISKGVNLINIQTLQDIQKI
ncbi:ACP S-malonyltransferase [Persephonella atlantica]|uniref:Malonyl CoA-acyl carrier protein transacylase n=1 Tax=Persephonella atlantica TaxID=2699429 RepID=A0ABS1GI58_9AQUI|nr:ACP S-malonyltransferase [Persephonella atlantica]MBK3332612.1 ACP S-malonyltransferase [Persephonella atlantica]